GLALEQICGGGPLKRNACAGDTTGLDVLDAKLVRTCVRKWDREVLDRSIVTAGGWQLGGSGCWRSGGLESFAVQIDGELQLVLAWVADGETELEVEGLGSRNAESAHPANGKGLVRGVRGFHGICEGP